MKILVLNCGSSSLKYQLFDMDKNEVLAKGNCERIGIEGSFLKHKKDGKELLINKSLNNHEEALKEVFNALTTGELKAVNSINEIDGIGHRMVNAGEKFIESTLITDEVLKELEKTVDFAPLHNPAFLTGVKACIAINKNIPNVVVLDTSFHATMPKYAYLYAIPQKYYKELHIRRYGAHGTSHRYVAEVVAKKLDKPVKEQKVITCHIGNGASISAVQGGKCVDTSMGFTPLAGVMMGTRSGDIDPAIIEFICKKTGDSVSKVINMLNKESGLLGISGFSSDSRDICAQMNTNENAKLAMDMMCYSIIKYIGAYAAVMNGVDAIVFTAGIGENSYEYREKILNNLSYLGLKYDKDFNKNSPRGIEKELSTKDSMVKVFVIPTNEELVIAQDTLKLIKK